MLYRAKERLRRSAIRLPEHDLKLALPLDRTVDAVVSGLAVPPPRGRPQGRAVRGSPRLPLSRRRFRHLDLARPASAHVHERFRREIGRVEDDPTDRFAGLDEQMEWLRGAGFAEVECHFKCLELALVVAVR
jgi:hypothetical protein